jgi:hypothetical protein
MSRRFPYKDGWLSDVLDGSPLRDEYHPLSPSERDFRSYIRVGVLGLGVLCVDSSDEGLRLEIADRELARAFADIMTIPGSLKDSPARRRVANQELQESEEAS